jgi:hypothetical protein
MDETIEELNSGDYSGRAPYRRIAARYGSAETTLRRRFLGIGTSLEVKNIEQQRLTPQQQRDLIKWIGEETQGHQPPGRYLVAQKASLLAGEEVGNGWVYRFLHRHQDDLVYKKATPMERLRAQADSWWKYNDYFTYTKSKVEEYQVLPENTYNMDETGVALGMMHPSKRIFSRSEWERGRVRATIHDGSRECITILACICADGTALEPGLVYQSDTPNVLSSWVEDISQEQPAFVAASTSGWTNNDLGLQWLVQVFDRLTKWKSRLAWRLLYVDGHASHVTLDFLEYCKANKTLVAQFPPHATHTLQPLNVVVFKSLSSAYDRALPLFYSHLLLSPSILLSHGT